MSSLSLLSRAPPGSGCVQSLLPCILSGSSPTTAGPEPGFPRPGLAVAVVEPGKALRLAPQPASLSTLEIAQSFVAIY